MSSRGVSNYQVRAAFRALDTLKAAPGRTRNSRLLVLRKHRRNRALKHILWTGTHPYQSSKFLLPTNPPNPEPGMRGKPKTNWRKFLMLNRSAVIGVQKPERFFPAMQKFFSACSEQETEIYHQVLTKKLKAGTASKIAAKVWPEFNVVLPRAQGSDTGMQFYFIVERSGCVSAITPKRRPYPILADRFGSTLSQLGRSLIFVGTVTSSAGDPLLQKFLALKAKSMTRAQFLYFFRSMRLTITEVYEQGTCPPISMRRKTAILRKYRRFTRSIKAQVKIELKS